MKLTLLIAGLAALVTAIPHPAPEPAPASTELIDFVARAENFVAGAGTEQKGADDVNCDVCHNRYFTCVRLAFVPGLPACEQVCRNRVKASDEICKYCGGQFYPNYNRVLPPIPFKRPGTQ